MSTPPPLPVLAPATNHLLPASVRTLRADPSLAPGGGAFSSVVSVFLPLVYGIAVKLVPDNSPAAERIALATFECFAARFPKLPRRTLLGPWLFAAAASVAARERKRLRLRKPARASAEFEHLLLFRRSSRLKRRIRDALVLRYVLGLPPQEAAAALEMSERKVENASSSAVRILRKQMRKTALAAGFPAALKDLPAAAPAEVSEAIVNHFSRWSPKAPRAELTRSILVSWQWFAVRRIVKRVLAGMGAVVVVLALVAATFVYLAHHGYLNNFFIAMGQRQMAKDHPELLQPARPWPVTNEDAAFVRADLPKDSAELFTPSNIWVAHISFTRDQWRAIQPTRIQPVRNMHQNGRIALRNPNAKRSGLSGSLGYEFNWAHADLEFAGRKFTDVAVRYRGNGTYVQSLFGPKQSFKVDLDKFNKKQELAGIDELNFANSVPDQSYIRDAMSQYVFRQLGVLGPRTAYAYLSIDVPGKWENQALGLYCLIENIDKRFAKDRFGTKKVPIFKPVTYELFKDLGPEWQAYLEIYDLKTDATQEQLQRVIELAQLVTHASDEEFAERVGEFLDLEQFAAFVAGHVLLSSYDGFLTNGQNYYLYLDPETGKFGFIAWDQDHSWGEFGYVSTAENRERASIWEPWVYEFDFLKRTMNVPAFREVYRKKLEGALDSFFTKDRLYPEIDRLAAAIRPAVAAESDFRLERFDQSISGEWVIGDRNAGPAEGPRAPVHQIKRFIENRIESVRDQLEGRSEGVRLRRGR